MFWFSAAAGWAIIAWGVAGALRHHIDSRPVDLLRFVAGGILVHDLAAVPLALLVAAVVNRAVPPGSRRWIQATLVIVGCLALLAYPLLRGFGRLPTNPTALPHDYAVNLAWVLLVVVMAVACVAVGGVVRRRGDAGGGAGDRRENSTVRSPGQS